MQYKVGDIIRGSSLYSFRMREVKKGQIIKIHDCCSVACADILILDSNDCSQIGKTLTEVSPSNFEIFDEKTVNSISVDSPVSVTSKIDVDSISKTVEKATFRPRITHRTIYSKKATIVILPDGTKGVAKCAPDDVYNEEKGHTIALKRAMIKKLNKELKELTK
jgi:hypothetical protein